MIKKRLKLADAFEKREYAEDALKSYDSWYGDRKVRKLRGKQRLQYGVYLERS